MGVTFAFHPPHRPSSLGVLHSTSSSSSSSSSNTLEQHQQQQHYSGDHIKHAGGGVPLVASGSQFWNPGDAGRLGGTGVLEARLQQGYQYLPSAAAPTTTIPPLQDAQHWLEDLEQPVPPAFAKATNPVTATVLGRGRLIAEDAPGDIQHIVLQLPEGMHYVEGQSLSVIPPGLDPQSQKPHKPRLYSIASTRYGDLLDGRTVSLCVRRAEYVDPVTGQTDPTKQGVCSNFLCDTQPNDTVQVAGPVGKTMLLPSDPTRDIILVATGTGIAPFRGFLQRLFMENTVARHLFTGHAWLILGVPTTGGLLYTTELQAMQQNAAVSGLNNLEITYAISREMTNAAGGKLYVQDVLQERAEDLLERLLHRNAVIYFCGLKGMMPGILQALEVVSQQRGLDWNQDLLPRLKANHQWHVEVY